MHSYDPILQINTRLKQIEILIFPLTSHIWRWKKWWIKEILLLLVFCSALMAEGIGLYCPMALVCGWMSWLGAGSGYNQITQPHIWISTSESMAPARQAAGPWSCMVWRVSLAVAHPAFQLFEPGKIGDFYSCETETTIFYSQPRLDTN